MSERNTVKLDGPEDMLPEYDLDSMRIVQRGPGHARKNAAKLLRVTIDSDLAAVFADDRAVNEALRTLLRMCASANEESVYAAEQAFLEYDREEAAANA